MGGNGGERGGMYLHVECLIKISLQRGGEHKRRFEVDRVRGIAGDIGFSLSRRKKNREEVLGNCVESLEARKRKKQVRTLSVI